MRLRRFLKQFNWRFLLVRIVVNALALAVTAAITPKIFFVDKSVGNWLLMAVMLGVLNALIKPLLQFLTLQFIFVTYGLVIVLVNALLLWLLSLLFPARFAVESFWWLLFGGLVLGLLSSFLESLLGLTMPIVPDEPPELRQQLEEQAYHASRFAAVSNLTGTKEQALPIETPAPNANAAEAAAAEAAVTEPSRLVPAEGLSPPEATRAEPLDPLVAEDPEPTITPSEEQEEDRR